MNTFAKIKCVAEYKKVTYYSVSLNNNEDTLFENFIEIHSDTNRKKLNHILSWIRIVGNKYGAQTHYFRPEAEISDTSAFPPKGKDRKPVYIENGKKKANNLRLYCFRANENVVFLFNGDIKTTKKAQNCPNVGPHFKLANQLTRAIENAFKEGNIKWTAYYDDILYDEELMIEL